VFGAAIGVVSTIWLTLLSGWLGVKPGMMLAERTNVLFQSDTFTWTAWMLASGHILILPINAVHPLQVILWSLPCRIVAFAVGLFMPQPASLIFAARLFVAMCAASGIGYLAWFALRIGMRGLECAILFTMYLLFTSNSTICLPEHFAISNALLTIAFVAPIFAANSRMRFTILGILTVLIGGTTVTNVIFPVLSAVGPALKSPRLRLAAFIAASFLAIGVAYFLNVHTWIFHHYIGENMRWRIFHDPLGTGTYLFYFLVSPVVGPHPLIVNVWEGQMVSYDPPQGTLSMARYLGIQLIGGVAWLILLFRCTLEVYRNQAARFPLKLLSSWLAFNCVFHNVWGDDLSLYAPHWSWALMALVAMGAPRLPRRFVLVAALLVIIAQVPALLEIKKALETITS
jgi:hypothetical protein